MANMILVWQILSNLTHALCGIFYLQNSSYLLEQKSTLRHHRLIRSDYTIFELVSYNKDLDYVFNLDTVILLTNGIKRKILFMSLSKETSNSTKQLTDKIHSKLKISNSKNTYLTHSGCNLSSRLSGIFDFRHIKKALSSTNVYQQHDQSLSRKLSNAAEDTDFVNQNRSSIEEDDDSILNLSHIHDSVSTAYKPVDNEHTTNIDVDQKQYGHYTTIDKFNELFNEIRNNSHSEDLCSPIHHHIALSKSDHPLYFVAEVIVHEESYINYLHFQHTVFLPTISYYSNLLNYSTLYQLTLKLLGTMVNEQHESLASCYENFVDVLSNEYSCKNTSGNIIKYQMMSMDKTYGNDALRGMSTIQCLLRPIQQLPRYRLHIERYIDYLLSLDKEEFEDNAKNAWILSDLRAKNSLVHKVIIKCNQSVGVNYKEVLKLQERISRHYLKFFLDIKRKLVYHGPVMKINSRDGDKSFRYLILFSDLLLVCSSSIDIGSASKLDIVHQTLSVNSKVYMERLANHEQLRLYFEKRIIDFETDMIEKWIDVLDHSCGVVYGSPGKSLVIGERAPLWQHDDSALACQICGRKFHTVYRRHHCRGCGKLVCSICSRHRSILKYTKSTKKLRVCDQCFQEVNLNFTPNMHANFLDGAETF
ncbi:hypothetical protein GJ496_003971 [Pomphorhynchus laevis]|nr:hypothetical protein GJ496_003971 [Pomphorhynchus laevis]